MVYMTRQPHTEFPQFRSKLAAMGARKRQSVARESLHSMERTLSQFVPAEEVQKLGSLPGTRNRWLPLPLVFWSFLQMVMDPNSSTREAQRSIQAWWRQKGRSWSEPSSRAFCEARIRLPLEWLVRVWWKLADRLSAQSPSLPGCHGRRVLAADGTTVLAQDTLANQQQWPQLGSQKPGCGFPIIYLVGIFCLASGALLRATHGPRTWHESRLFAFLRRWMRKGDILVADRGFWSYLNFSLLPSRGVDLIVRTKYAAKIDWRRGRQLGVNDRLITMRKPREISTVVGSRCWNRLAASVVVRQVRVRTKRKGFRDDELVITTTLLDPVLWPVETLVRLYERRWRIEMNFDDLKTSQAAAMMRCKSPAMVRRELVMHAIAYNIIRRLMQESAITFDASLDRISFKGTADTFRAWRGVLAAAGHAKAVDAFVHMLIICALDKLPHRPGRHEPRAVKKRPKPYSLLTAPRNVFTVAASRRNKGRPKRKLIPVPPILCA